MEVSDATLREITRIIRKHVDQPTLDRIIEELLDVPGNKSFREIVEAIERELRPDGP
jgi:hypothetical protein